MTKAEGGEDSMSAARNYERHRGTRLWLAIDRALAKLEANDDLVLRTQRDYVIGYLCARVIATTLPAKRRIVGSSKA